MHIAKCFYRRQRQISESLALFFVSSLHITINYCCFSIFLPIATKKSAMQNGLNAMQFEILISILLINWKYYFECCIDRYCVYFRFSWIHIVDLRGGGEGENANHSWQIANRFGVGLALTANHFFWKNFTLHVNIYFHSLT